MSEAVDMLRAKLAQQIEIAEWEQAVGGLTPEEEAKAELLILNLALTNARVTAELDDRISALERRAPVRRIFEPHPMDMRW